MRFADRTMIGTVAVLASQTSNTVSTLQRETWRAAIFITISAIGAAILVLVLGLLPKLKVVVVINLMITGIAANFPCRHRDSWRVRVYFSDKAGTLPQARVTVQSLWLNGSFEMLCGAVIVGAVTPEEPRFRRAGERARARARGASEPTGEEGGRQRGRERQRQRESERERGATDSGE